MLREIKRRGASRQPEVAAGLAGEAEALISLWAQRSATPSMGCFTQGIFAQPPLSMKSLRSQDSVCWRAASLVDASGAASNRLTQ